MKKVRKALSIEGPKFMNIISSCNRGWRSRTDDSIALSRLAVETCFWPLYEIEDKNVRVTFKPKEKKPLTDFLKSQGRFKNLMLPDNEWLLQKFQADIDREWELLLKESVAAEPKKKD
jgi:pyruvate ferredoxin oxidoreductase beta subunit